MSSFYLICCVIILLLYGAGFRYWLVRKYIISEDGEVDVRVAVTCIILSTKDTPLAMAAVGSCLGVYYMITKIVRKMPCRIYATLKELNLGMMEKEWNVSFHWNRRFLNEFNSFHFLEFMKRNNFVSPKVAYETATTLQSNNFVSRKVAYETATALQFALDIDLDALKFRIPIRLNVSSKYNSHFRLDFGHFTLRKEYFEEFLENIEEVKNDKLKKIWKS
ncbi:hypothetical protein Lser_V15G25356 [Lactuca serriola]